VRLSVSLAVLAIACHSRRGSGTSGQGDLKLQEVMIGAGRSKAPDGDFDARGSTRTASDSFSAHAYGVPEKPPSKCLLPGRSCAGRLHLCHPELRGDSSRRLVALTSQVDLSNPKATKRDDRRLRQHRVAMEKCTQQQRKVGMYGVSYDGLTARWTLLTQPGVEAIS